MTEEELKSLMRQGTQTGVFDAGEQEIVARVLRLGERRVGELVTPRSAMVALDVNGSAGGELGEGRRQPLLLLSGLRGRAGPRARPGLRQGPLAPGLAGETPDLRSLLKEPVYLPEGMSAVRVLERLRETGSHLALVMDEYGGIEGLVTLHDVLRAIVGELPTLEQDDAMAVRREDGSWLLDGMLSVSDLPEILGLAAADTADLEEFQTLGGFVMSRMGRVPQAGERFEWAGRRFEVVDMDGRRVDKVLVAREDVQVNPAS